MKLFWLSLLSLLFFVSSADARFVCNKVWQEIDSTGTTDPLTLGAAVSGNQTMADCGVANGQSVPYSIFDGAAWEVGWGVYSSAGPTLTRNVQESSNADSEINLTSAATLVLAPLAEDYRQFYINLHSFAGGL